MPQADGGSGGVRPRRRKKEEEEELPNVGPLQEISTDTPEVRIGKVEKATGAILPTRMTLGLADTTAQGETLERVSRLIARKVDIPPTYLFGRTKYADYSDPIWGGEVRLDTLQRMSVEGVNASTILALAGQ